MDENYKLRGIVEYLVTDKNGNIKEKRVINNQIQDSGLVAIASLLTSENPQSATGFSYIAIGTGTGQGTGATTLGGEISTGGGERKGVPDVTITSQTTTIVNDTTQFQALFEFTNSFAITEAGIFNAASGGDMLSYQDFAAINVTDGDNLQITWKVVSGR